jgi:phytoene synthase
MDASDAKYETLDDTLLYCYYVAGVVGIMMAYVMGTREPTALQRATDLGIAFQLTNISRDVKEDAQVGRVYLPGDWLRAAGIDGDLLEARQSAALAGVVKRLLFEADRYYASANEGLRSLGFRSAWAVASARGVYRAIGEIVRDRGERAWQERVVVRKRRKLLGLANGMLDAAKASIVERYTEPTPRDTKLWSAPPAYHVLTPKF